MTNKKRQIKLFTWKYVSLMCVVLAIVFAFELYGDYKKKGYLQIDDLVSLLVPLIPFILIVLGIAYLSNHSGKEK